MGEEIGSVIAGAVTGSAMTKVFGKIKAFQKLKLDAGDAKKIASKTDGKSPIIDCPTCFTAGTEVKTITGFKPIEEIVIGDSVLSFDEHSGKSKYQRVTDTHRRYADTIYVIYALGTSIETTGDHPFFINGEWIRAEQLKSGHLLTLANGQQTAISRVDQRYERTAVYNFTVENYSTYTVGQEQFLVHNCEIAKYGDLAKSKTK